MGRRASAGAAAVILAAGGVLIACAGSARVDEQPGCAPIRIDGRLMRCADGAVFRWRGVTGFRLVHQIANGDEPGATRYLDWARETGFTVVRTVSTEQILFDLPPAQGQAALPRAIALASARGLFLEVVAVTDTGERAYDYRAHARRVAEICAAHPTCVFEFANEPGHPTQVDELHDMAALDRMAADAVRGLTVPWTAGASWKSDVERVPTGAYVVRHLDRGGSGWQQAGRLEEFERLSAALGKPVVSNEPIGFDEVHGSITRRQRLDDCDVALAFGALSRALEVGTTFHLQAGLMNEMPGPVQRRCATAFIRGTRVLPDALVVRRADGADAASPVGPPAPGSGPVLAGTSDGRAIAVAIGPNRAGAVSPRTGWTIESTPVDEPEIKVWLLKAATSPLRTGPPTLPQVPALARRD